MKHIHLILLLALAASAHAGDYAAGVIDDNATFYRERTDRVVQSFLQRGTYPSSDDLVRIQTLENHFLAAIRLDPAVRGRTPTLLLSKINMRDLRNVPGQFIVERAKGSGLDLRTDRLEGRSFRALPAFSE